MARQSGTAAVRRFLGNRVRLGARRSADSLYPVIQITVGGLGAYAIAEYLLGHQGPIFAATSALIALGFSREPRMRRVLEVAIGCTLGITVGDILLTLFGTGLWQAAVVLFVSLMLARFLDRGSIFTTQLGLQSLLVVLLPVPAGGPFTRSLDAVVGGLVALAITMAAPRDPRREPKSDAGQLLDELASILRDSSRAVARSDATLAWHALVRARNCQPLVDSLTGTLRAAQEVAALSLAHRRHRDELVDLRRSVHYVDLAIRNSRVLTRRLTSVINHAALTDPAIESIAGVLEDTADAVRQLANALSAPDRVAQELNLRRVRSELASIAIRLHPKKLSITGLEGQGFLLLFRPLLVDLLEAAGLSHDEAAGYLPRL